MSSVTVCGPLNPSAMQTMVVVLFGTVAGLQFEARLQLPEAPPTQLVVPEAGHEVPPAVRANVAITVCAELIVTIHVPVPEHPPPLQPVKTEPDAASAVRVTCWPIEKAVLHVG